MNGEIKAKWLAALRSGKYEQGEGALFNNNKFCCLGVLCEIHSDEVEDLWEVDQDGVNTYDSDSGLLPAVVMEWAGLTSKDPRVQVSEDKEVTVSYLNDEGHSFKYIADIIEREL